MPSPVPPGGGGSFGRFDSQGTTGTDGQEDDDDDGQTDREGEYQTNVNDSDLNRESNQNQMIGS